MSLVRQDVKNLVAGISQQPQRLRFPEQLEEQCNGMSNGPQGLQKRPPTRLILKLADNLIPPNITPMIHSIERDEFEKYHMLFTGSSVVIVDSEGVQRTITYEGSALSYITSATPRSKLKAVTIADYTFVINTDKEVEMNSELTSNVWETQGALINIKSGQYGRTYTISINGVLKASYTTPNGSVATDVTSIDTNYIATQLSNALTASGVTNVRGESYIYINQVVTSLKTSDGFNNTAMLGFLHATQKFTDLPRFAPDGFTIVVKGNNEANTDDYYVKFDSASNCWVECARPALLASYDASTMPHVLIRNSDGSFTCKEAPWDKRLVGDDDSCPIASFVGKTLNDIFFVRNRLGVLAGENVILSKSGEFFNFWMTTATAVLDNDMIDQAVPDESVAILYHAVVFNEELLLFSGKAQFVGSSDSVFSPKTFRINRTTKFDCIPACKPLSVGRRIYFANQRSEESSIMEFYIVEDVTAVKNAQDISGHVPNLIPNTVYKLIGQTSENILIALSSGTPNRLYVYKYFWADEQRVQASWSYWDFGTAEIVGAGFFGSKLSLITKRGTTFSLEEATFTVNTKDSSIEPYRIFLDRKVNYTIPVGFYDGDSNTTVVPLDVIYNASVPLGDYGAVGATDGKYTEATKTNLDKDIILNGNQEGTVIIVGELIKWFATFSEVMIKNDDGKGGVKADTSGTLQVRSAWINYEDSGVFDVHVTISGKRMYCYSMTSRTLGKTTNILGALPFASGSFKFPVQADSKDASITVASQDPSQISVIGYGWEANHVQRGGRG